MTVLQNMCFCWTTNHELCHNNWSFHIKSTLETSRDIVNFNLKGECKIDNVRKALIEQFIVEWNQQIFKDVYVMQTLYRSRRSFLAQFRLGILPPENKTGKYTPVYERHPSEISHTSYNMDVKMKFISF